MNEFKIVQAIGMAEELKQDIEHWYLDSHEQIHRIIEICKEIQKELEDNKNRLNQ